ncbi:ABC transporter ATP-binding protein [bacterium]|nr:ABC transporter ATP-binding protein [bacterium]
MSVLISAHELEKSFGAKALFKGLTFAIHQEERIGLIGPNGTGKSTLLRILSSQDSPDAGKLSFQRGLRIGYLQQVPTFRPNSTIWSTIAEGSGGAPSPDERRVAEWISKLELDRFDPETPTERLSGGWRKRVALGRELVNDPELLLLDEPTNHLDVESILWLEQFLARARLATLTITHDRAFLSEVANRIIELDPRHPNGLLSVQGDYATFLETRAQLIASQERREVILRNTLRREVEWLRRGAKARTTKQQARIQRAGELQSEVDGLAARNVSRTARLDFGQAGRTPRKLIEAKGISKAFGDRSIFSKFDLLISPGTRLGLLGLNGCGKSTLIRVLLGQEPATMGEIFRSDQLKVAYFDQSRETLDPTLTVLKTVCPSGEFVDYRDQRLHVRSYLDRFLFSPTQMEMTVGKLSGGEQARLLIAQLMLRPANVLVLDEPTNDLDMATLGVLEECLIEFDGAVILVSHDRFFLSQVANTILAFPQEGSELVSFADLDQWENWITQQGRENRQKLSSQNTPAQSFGREETPPTSKKKKLSYKDQRELDMMEQTIAAAEARLAKATEESALPENMSNSVALARLSKEMDDAQKEIDRLYSRWAELES